ncbi:dTMP kinase [Sphingomicrobium sp. XHP0235]|uniref:dTMP kinase n=1 Tax=Sphingomicrobium aquimarinum TaxID=3133971 RepID=UPI0031FE903E
MARGRFISLEGGEGVGKSTQLAALANALEARGLEVVVTREPGGSEGAEAIRALLLGGDEGRWSPRAEALLFAAARADHIEKTVQPALAEGRWVLSDRYLDSSLAYQGEAGGLGREAIRALHRFGSENFLPDRTLVLTLDASEAATRAETRDGGRADRIGGRGSDYHAAVARGFAAQAAAEPERVRLVDAGGDASTVTARLVDALADLLP